MTRFALLGAALAACEATPIDVSPRRDAALEEVAARPPRDDSEEVALDAGEAALVNDTETRCDDRDDDGDGLVDEGFEYVTDAAARDLLTPGRTPVELRALAANGDGFLAVAQGGFWDTRSPLLAVHFDATGTVVRSHALVDHQPSPAFPLCLGGACVVFGQQRSIACAAQPDRCLVFAWPVPASAAEARAAPALPPTRQTLGGPASVDGRVWVPLTRPRDDGGEALVLREWLADGRWADEVRTVRSVGVGQRILSVRGVAIEGGVAWIYNTERARVEAVFTDARGAPLGRADLSAQGQLLDDSPVAFGHLGDSLFGLFAVPNRGVVLGRWSMSGHPLQRPIPVALYGNHFALAVGHGQVLVVFNGVGNASVVQRYAPDGQLLQRTTLPKAIGEDRVLVATTRGFRYVGGLYHARRLVTTSLRCR